VIFFIFLLLPPLKGSLVPTSGFGDYRPFHFHTGIDLSTGNIEGVPLYAVEDGSIYKVKVSYTGYGKTLYLKLYDGRIIVYAHLLRFTPYLDSLVFFKQLEKKSYSINLFDLPPIRFKKGDLVGYSGQSGAGPPHLHLEVRSPSNHPLNPLNFLPIKDTIPPVMVSVTFVPRKKGSLVDGYPIEKTFKLIWRNGGYTLDETPNLLGNFGIILSAYDRLVNEYRLPIYRVLLFIDGELMYSAQIDSIDFEKNPLSELYYHSKGSSNSKGIRLFHFDKIRLPQVITSASSYKLSPGLHEVLIEIFDLAKNKSSANFIVESDKFVEKGEFVEPEWHLIYEENGETLALYSNDRGLLVKTSGNVYLELDGEILPTLHEERGYFYYFLDKPGFIKIKGAIEKGILGALIGKEGGYIPFGPFVFEIEENSLPEPIPFWITEISPEDTLIAYIDEPILILPPQPSSLKSFHISLSEKGLPEKTGIFVKDEKWNFVGKNKGVTRSLGIFALLRDTIPPYFKSYRWEKGDLVGILLDDESGIDIDSMNFFFDDEWVPVDYDVETGLLRFHPVIPVSKGFHIFELKVKDRMGNQLEKKVKIRLR